MKSNTVNQSFRLPWETAQRFYKMFPAHGDRSRVLQLVVEDLVDPANSLLLKQLLTKIVKEQNHNDTAMQLVPRGNQ